MTVTQASRYLVTPRSDDRGLLPLVSPTTQLGANSTGSASGVAIGFSFTFEGTAYSTCYLSAYGFLRLAGTLTSSTNSNLWASSTNIVLAPWYDRMKTAEGSGYIKTETQGVAPFRRFIVEWRNYLTYSQTAANNDLAVFQCVLYETTSRFEFRYATRVRTGSPGYGSASVGFKGNTSSVTTNLRSCTTVNHALGGSTSTLSTSLTWSTYDIVAQSSFVCEPAWPMSGRYFPLVDSDLTGLQDPYGEPAWKIANNVNWLWCRHGPPAVSFAPQERTERAAHTYVVPVRLSADAEVTYRAMLEVYATTGALCTVTLWTPAVADPDPTDNADWTTLATSTDSVSSGLNTLEIAGIATASDDILRWTISVASGLCIVHHVALAPALRDTFDIKGYTSGFVPMGLGQIRQVGAPVHPEWFNRAWRSLAYVLADRAQVVWSSVWPHYSLLEIAATASKPERVLGVAACTLRDRPAQLVKARIWARDDVGGAKVWISESGANSVELDVIDDKYRLVEEDLQLVGSLPTVTMSARPVGNLSVMGAVLEWSPDLSTDDLIEGVTPAPRLEYLFALAERMRYAFTAYAVPGLCGLFARGKYSTDYWPINVIVPPGTRSLQPRIARAATEVDRTAEDSRLFGDTSGSGAQDEVIIPSPHTDGVDAFPPEGRVVIAAGSRVWAPLPTVAQDRLLESPTETDMSGPARERVRVLRGVGVTFVPNPVSEAL